MATDASIVAPALLTDEAPSEVPTATAEANAQSSAEAPATSVDKDASTSVDKDASTSVDKDASQAPQEPPPVPSDPATNNTDAGVPAAGAKDKPSNIVLHHLNNSRSQRVLWLLEELEVPYSIVKHTRGEDMRAPKKLKDIHPSGKAPIITDGDVTIAESGAIVEYLLSLYGQKFRPTEAGRLDDIYFSHYAEGSLMPTVISRFIFSIIPQKSPALIRPLLKPVFTSLVKRLVDPELKAQCALIESSLEKSRTGWLAGGDHPTAADFMMMFPVEIIVTKLPFSGPKTKEYFKRIHQRPAYTRGIEKGGEYEYAKL